MIGGALAVPEEAKRTYSWGGFLLYFLRLGSLGFGGPIALAGYMQRDLVEERAWITKQDYTEGLALAQLSPGPLAAQLAIYLGWIRGRILGAFLVSLAFVGPSFVMVLGLSALYVAYGGLPWMQGAFYGIAACVTAIIGRSSLSLLKKTLGRERLLWAIAVGNAGATAWFQKEIVWLVVGGGLAVLFGRQRGDRAPSALLGALPLPAVLVSGLHGAASAGALVKILWYFTTAGAFVFGSGLAIVPFLHGGVVTENQWLTERQFLDAVAVAMITPGPVVITVAFIGYLVAGPAGALLAAIGVFVPCFVIVVVAAPHFRRLAAKRRIKDFVDGVTAGAVGAIAGAVIVLARRSIVDFPTALVATASVVVLVKLKRVPEPMLILAAGIVGMALVSAHLV
jgi:chromate transporter